MKTNRQEKEVETDGKYNRGGDWHTYIEKRMIDTDLDPETFLYHRIGNRLTIILEEENENKSGRD